MVLRVPTNLVAGAASVLRYVVLNILHSDTERVRRLIQNAQAYEELRARRLQNLASAYELAEKISDPQRRQHFLNSVDSSIKPLLIERPQIKSVEIGNE